jgi:hypothetical protein
MSIGPAELRFLLLDGQTAEIRSLSDRKVCKGTIEKFHASGASVELILEHVLVRPFNRPTWFERKNKSPMNFQFDAYASRLVNGVHIALKSVKGHQTCYIWNGGTALALP